MKPGAALSLAFGAVVAAFGLATGHPILAVVGIGLGLASLLRTRAGRARVGPTERLGAEARSLVRPLEQARARLGELAERHRERPEVAVVASEAAREAQAVVEKATEIALARQRLKETLRGRGRAETELGRLERLIAQSTGEVERAVLQAALASRRDEIGQLDAAQRQLDALGASLRQAEAVLGALTARLAASAVASQTDALDRDGLESALASLRTFGASLDEARAMIGGGRG